MKKVLVLCLRHYKRLCKRILWYVIRLIRLGMSRFSQRAHTHTRKVPPKTNIY